MLVRTLVSLVLLAGCRGDAPSTTEPAPGAAGSGSSVSPDPRSGSSDPRDPGAGPSVAPAAGSGVATAMASESQCKALLGHLVDLEFLSTPAAGTDAAELARQKAAIVEAQSVEFLEACGKMPRARVECALAASDLDAAAKCDALDDAALPGDPAPTQSPPPLPKPTPPTTSTPPTKEPTSPTPPTKSTPPPTPPKSSVGPKIGEACGAGDACGEGVCVSYRGIAGARGPEFKTCELRCGGKGACPAGRSCITIADGPGQVCR